MNPTDISIRASEFEINSAILNRWSPRSMTGETLPHNLLLDLFEAARWAPSSFNNQPWRFIYAERDSEHWTKFLALLNNFNQSWAKNASALVVVISAKNFEHNGKPSKTHAFDAGASWENLAIEATTQGLAVHAMEGFDYEKARNDLDIPQTYEIHAMIAIGKQGKVEKLPKELQEKETMSERKPLSEIIMNGKFNLTNKCNN